MRPQRKMFMNQPEEFLKEPETQDFPSGLQGRDKCHLTSSPSSTLLGITLLFIYYFPLCLLYYEFALR